MGKIDKISKDSKRRTSVYLTQENLDRLAKIPRGEKTKLINEALDEALSELEREKKYKTFVKSLGGIKRVKPKKPSEEMVRELRKTGTVAS